MGSGDAAGEFAESVRERVLRARAELAEAAARQDASAVQAAVDELEDALAVARVNGVEVPPGQDQDGSENGPANGPERG